MHKGKCFDIAMAGKGFRHFLWRHGSAPCILNHNGGCTYALDVLFHASTEYPILADDDAITGLYQVDKRGFHAGRSGCRDWQSKLVLGLKNIL